MQITDYQFGKIRIDGDTYTSDVILFPDKVDDHWWRQQGHRLQIEDLQNVIDYQPEALVIGTGYFGRMTVPKETQLFLQDHGIKLTFAPTSKAIKEFNELQKTCAKIVAALHLTC